LRIKLICYRAIHLKVTFINFWPKIYKVKMNIINLSIGYFLQVNIILKNTQKIYPLNTYVVESKNICTTLVLRKILIFLKIVWSASNLWIISVLMIKLTQHMLLVLIFFSLPAQMTATLRKSMKEKIAEMFVPIF